MADGYLPPVVVRLVAETAEAVAALEQFGAAVTAIGERATAAGAEVDSAMTTMAASTQRVDAAMTEAGASVDRFAAQATAANETAAASTEAVVAAEARVGQAAAAAGDASAAASDKAAAGKAKEADATAREAEAESAAAAKAQAAYDLRQIAIDKQIASYNKMNQANDIEVRNAQASAAKTGAAWDAAANQTVAAEAKTDAAIAGANTKIEAQSGAAAAATQKLGMLGIGAGIVAGETVKMASTFDQSMNKLVTMAGQPQPVVDALKQKVLALGASTGQGPDKLSEGLYHLVSTGMSADQAMAALTSSAKLATMGTADLDTVTYALAGIMSAAPKDIQNTDQAVALMSSTVGMGDMNVQGFANSMKSGLLPTMIQAGMGMRDYAATLATVSDNSIPPEMAANRLRTSITMLSNETSTKAVNALKDLGMTGQQVAQDMRSGGMLQVVTDLKAHMDNLKPAAGDVKMSLQQVNDAGKEYYDQMIQDGASADEAAKGTDIYKQSLTQMGSAGTRAFQDIADATGGSKSASTILLLTDETGKLQQKYDQLGTSVDQEKKFQDNWNEAQQQTAVKAAEAKAGIQALGIQIGEELMPAVNAALGAVARFGAAITQGNGAAKIAADVIGGILVAAVAAYTAKMVVAVAQTIAWAVTGTAQFLIAVGRQVAAWGLLGPAAQRAAQAQKAAAAEADAGVQTAADRMVASWDAALEKMVASTRAAGPELAAAAGADGAEAGTAMTTGMAEAEAAGTAKVAAAGAEAGAAGGAASKTGFLGKFGKIAGDIGILTMSVMVADSFLPDSLNVEKNFSDLVDHINHAITGDALSPATNAMDATFGRMSNTVRDTLGLAKLYSDDGMTRLNTSITDGGQKAADNWSMALGPIPGGAQDAGAEAARGFGQGIAPLPPAAAKAGTDTGGGFLAGIKSAWDATNAWLDNMWGAIGRFFKSIGPGITQGAKDMWNGFLDILHELPRQFGIGIGQIGAYVVLAARDIGTHFVQGLKDGWNAVWDFVRSIPRGFMDGLGQIGNALKAVAVNIGTNFVQGLKDGWNAVWNFVKSIPQGFVDGLSGTGPSMKTIANNIATNFWQGLKDGWNAVWAFVKSIPQGFMDGLSQLGNLMRNVAVNVMQGFMDGLNQMVGAVTGLIKSIGQGIIDGFNGVLGNRSPSRIFQQSGVDLLTGLINGIQSLVGTVINNVTTFGRNVVNVFAGAGQWLVTAGVNFMQGFLNGITSMMNTITNTVQGWINGTVAAIRATLQINSPSRVMHEIGEGFLEGFHNGIIAYAPNVTNAVDNVNTAVINKLKQSQQQSKDVGWAMMQGWIENGGDIQDDLALKSMQSSQSGSRKQQFCCWICGQDTHKPIDCPNTNQVLTLTRANSGIGVQDGSVQAGVTNNITVQGAVLDHQGMFQALQEAALRSGQRNSFIGGFGSPR